MGILRGMVAARSLPEAKDVRLSRQEGEIAAQLPCDALI